MNMKRIDGFTSRPQQPSVEDYAARRQVGPLTAVAPRPFVPRAYAKPRRKTRRRIPQWLQMALIGIGALLAGSFVQSVLFGELAIVAYGICALIWRVPSRTTFTLAVVCVIATTWMLVMQGNVGLAQTFATYTFLFLVVGAITLSRELRREGGRIYNSRKTKTDH